MFFFLPCVWGLGFRNDSPLEFADISAVVGPLSSLKCSCKKVALSDRFEAKPEAAEAMAMLHACAVRCATNEGFFEVIVSEKASSCP